MGLTLVKFRSDEGDKEARGRKGTGMLGGWTSSHRVRGRQIATNTQAQGEDENVEVGRKDER